MTPSPPEDESGALADRGAFFGRRGSGRQDTHRRRERNSWAPTEGWEKAVASRLLSGKAPRSQSAGRGRPHPPPSGQVSSSRLPNFYEFHVLQLVSGGSKRKPAVAGRGHRKVRLFPLSPFRVRRRALHMEVAQLVATWMGVYNSRCLALFHSKLFEALRPIRMLAGTGFV